MKFKTILRLLFPWFLMGFLGTVLFVLYALGSSMSDIDREQTELDVREALAINTQIDLDILRLRYRELLIYDPLSIAANRVESLLLRIDDDFARLGISDLKEVLAAWHAKMLKIDDFKRQNSVLVNSIYHFINLSDRFNAAKLTNDQRTVLNAASRAVLIFVSEQRMSPRDQANIAINNLVKQAQSWKEADKSLAILFAEHGRRILENHLPVQEIMQEMSRNPFAASLSAAYEKFIDAYAEVEARNESYRKLMTLFSLFMILVVMAIVLWLQQIAQELSYRNYFITSINSHLGEGILSFDGKSALTFANPQAERLLGRSTDQLLGKTKAEIMRFTSDTENNGFKDAFSERKRYEGEVWLVRENGTKYPALILSGPMPTIDGDVGYVASFRDIMEQHEAQARLRLASRVFDNLAEGLAVVGTDGRIQTINAAFTKITGYVIEDAIGLTPGKLLGSGQHDSEFYRLMWQTLALKGKWSGEVINRRKNGELYPEWLSITAVRDRSNKIEQFIGLFSDISDRKQAEAHIHHLAYHDPLTGLANRMLFNDRLENAIHQAHRSGKPLAVIYLDLDRFKSVNDSLGHPIGDVLLKQAGKRLEALMREGDTLGRFGGDEFALLLSGIDDVSETVAMGRRILHSFDEPFDIDGRELFCSTSMGIAIYPGDADNADDLLKNVDVALYNAKNSGRANFQFFKESAGENFLAQLELETALRHSVARNELRLYYQPQVRSENEHIFGVEALVRWQHPTLGLIPPDRFISLAENIGYIETLGNWCLATACEQLVAWRGAGVPIDRVAVNVSARQLKNPKFLDTVMEIVKATKIDPRFLELELTESSMTDNPEKVMEVFSRLRQTGIRIAIDDFGTGYSSLSYLARYPVDVLKIDKSFVQSVGTASDTSKVVKSIALLAHSLSMEIVAEGVETVAQRDYLKSVGCELLQGYFYSRPVPADTIVTLPCVR
ncbi:hypothetical protein FACS189487_05940 [Campylobacterota bacterium]|nr:hypothetical protein FACS189487_05940 [Campylobacterota bacterium]